MNAARIVTVARGYVELGMYRQAARELDAIPPDVRDASPDIARMRALIHSHMQEWEQLKAVAERLAQWEPDNPAWPVTIAYASRRFEGLLPAHETLRRAVDRFPNDAVIHFNLGCYACQLGDLATARRLVERSIQIDPQLQSAAAEDPDLEPLRWPRPAEDADPSGTG